MTLPFKIKSVTIENTGFKYDGKEVKILEIDACECTISEKLDCIYDSGNGYTIGTRSSVFSWSFTRKKRHI